MAAFFIVAQPRCVIFDRVANNFMSADLSMAPDRKQLLGGLLKNVSRSFYLSLRVLPSAMRQPTGLAYLLARAADTIADTRIIPPEKRLELLLSFREQVNGPLRDERVREIEGAVREHQSLANEKALLEALVPALRLIESLSEFDRAEVRSIVTTLTRGMELDLTVFPPETSGNIVALRTIEELDRYIYLVAGCVGEFWTKLSIQHVPALHDWDANEMCARGVRFGKALQLTNVLRDCPADLRIGRCYLPLELLEPLGLKPGDLLDPGTSAKARPILNELLGIALGHYREAARYTLVIPRRCVRLRLACLWPILIGVPTLELLARHDAWLDGSRPIRLAQSRVNRMLAVTPLTAGSNYVTGRWLDKACAGLERAIHG
jgi:farnesyl-diphosphate farnesyltransferase